MTRAMRSLRAGPDPLVTNVSFLAKDKRTQAISSWSLLGQLQGLRGPCTWPVGFTPLLRKQKPWCLTPAWGASSETGSPPVGKLSAAGRLALLLRRRLSELGGRKLSSGAGCVTPASAEGTPHAAPMARRGFLSSFQLHPA